MHAVLPNDIWVDGIFPHLSIRDIIRVRQVSKLLYELTHTPMLWKNILRTVHYQLPPLPPTTRYSFASLSSFETERLIVRGLTLDANWCSRKPTMERHEYSPIEAYHEVLSMKMVPGGHCMVASVRDFGTNRYALLLFMMDHRVYTAYPIAKTLTASKAYHLQAKYMVHKGEMGIMIAYARREPARRADRMAEVNVSEFSEDHDIDFPVPVRYEVVVTHISSDAVRTLEDPIYPPGSAKYAEHVRMLDPPFRHVASLKTTVSVDFLELAEVGGEPYIFAGKRNQEIVLKNLATRVVSRIRMPVLFTTSPPARATTTFRAMRVLGNQRQILVVRTTTVAFPSPAELYAATQGEPPGQLLVAPEEPEKQHLTLELYDLPDDGATTDDFPQFFEHGTPKTFRDICISEYIPPARYYHPSLLQRLGQNIGMPVISVYTIMENPWEMLHLQLKPRRVPLHPPPPPDVNGEPAAPPPPPPPAELTTQRYDLDRDSFTEVSMRFEGAQDQHLHVFAGATRSLLLGTRLADRTAHAVPVDFFAYADLDPPTAEDAAAEARWPYDAAQRAAAAAERAWIDAAYRQRTPDRPIRPLEPPLAHVFGRGVVAAAWDEWSGRLCLVPGAEPRKVWVLEYAWAPREDEEGNRLPLPVHDVDMRFRRPVGEGDMDVSE